jgi:hypothetical protein
MTIDSELLAAAIFLVMGSIAVAFGWTYGFGTFAALGSGAMPVLIGVGLCAMGVVQLLRAITARRSLQPLVAAFPRAELRPLLVILGAVLAFGLLIDRLGLLPSLAALVCIGWLADSKGGHRQLLPVLALTSILIVVIFYYGLGVPFRLLSWRF